jgi:hypothetical protein
MLSRSIFYVYKDTDRLRPKAQPILVIPTNPKLLEPETARTRNCSNPKLLNPYLVVQPCTKRALVKKNPVRDTLYQMPKTIWCSIIGEDRVFSVIIDPAKTVDDLKKQIKAENLKDIDAGDLTLYRAEVNESSDRSTHIKALNSLSQNLDEDCALNEEEQLSVIFGENPQGKKYYALVRLPEGESIDSRARGAVLMAGGAGRLSRTEKE